MGFQVRFEISKRNQKDASEKFSQVCDSKH